MNDRRGRRQLLVAICALAVSACGQTPSVGAPPVAAPAVQLASPPAPLVSVTGTDARITWAAPAGGSPALSGYDVYVDRNPPVRVAPNVLSHALARLEQGSQHFVQVVAIAGDLQSRPAGVSFAVPYAPRNLSAGAGGGDDSTAGSVATSAPPPAVRAGGAQSAVDEPTVTAHPAHPAPPAAQAAPVLTTHVLRGTLRIEESTSGTTTGKLPAAGECLHNQKGYDDIHVGTQVTVKGSDGAIVGVGELVSGALVDRRPPTHYAAEPDIPGLPGSGTPAFTVIGGICAYTIRVDDVRPSPFYSVLIGKRDPWQISAPRLAAQKWSLALALGDGY